MVCGLIIIDMQRWFFRTEDRLAKLSGLLSGLNKLASAFASAGKPIVIVRTMFSSNQSTWDQYMRANNHAVLIENTSQVQDVEGLIIPDNAANVIKTRHSTFIRTDFENMLRQKNIDSIVLTGAFVDGCVGLTAIDAWERDFQVMIAKEAVVSTDEGQGNAMLHFLNVEFGIKALTHKEILDKEPLITLPVMPCEEQS
jgi:nicotinamidase-related amidase